MGAYEVNISLNANADDATRDFKRLNNEIDEIEDGADRGAKGIGGLETAALAAGAAFVASKVLEYGAELNELGDQASKTERAFVQLAGGAGAADDMMNRLRGSTLNTVSDMALQQNANTLLNTGLADTAIEVENLTSLGVQLSLAMGRDATEGLENFNSALLNSSYERLDSLGISASAVRASVSKLTASGMDLQQAFAQSVIEIGSASLSRMGNVIEENATEADKFNTRITNIKENLAESVNWHVNMSISVLDTALTSLDQLYQIFQIRGGTHPMQIAAEEQAKQMAMAWADEYRYSISQYMGKIEFDAGTGQAEAWVAAIDQAFELVIKDPSLLDNKQALMEAMTFIPESERDMMADGIKLAFNDKRALAAIEQGNEIYRQKQAEEARKNVAAYVDTFERAIQTNAGKLAGVADLFNIFKPPSEAALWEQQRQGIAAASSELDTFVNSYADMWPILDINNEADTGTLDRMLANATAELENFQALADQGLISDADLQKATDIVTNLQSMQDKITTIKGMTLDGLLGRQQGDGSLVGLQNMVLDEAGKSGMYTAEELAAISNQFELSSGRETESGMTLEGEVVPFINQIGQQLGEKAMDDAINNVNAFLEQAANQGLSDAQIAAGLVGSTGFTQTGAAGASFEVKPGESAGAAAARMGMSVDEFLNATGSKDARSVRAGSYNLPGGIEAIAGFDPSQLASSMIDDTTVQAVADVQSDIEQMGQDMPGITTEFTAVNQEVTTIQSVIADMASKVHKISVELDIKGLDVLNAALGMFGGGSAGTGTSVQNNGGRVPGMDERTAA